MQYNMMNKALSVSRSLVALLQILKEGRNALQTVVDYYRTTDSELKRKIENTVNDWVGNTEVWNNVETTTPLIGQEQWFTCGAASGRMVLASLGIEVSEKDFATRAGTYVDGSTVVYKLQNALNYYIGSNTYKYKYTASLSSEDYLNNIKASLSNGFPIVVNVGIPSNNKGVFNYSADGHYVVITGIKEAPNGSVTLRINDPYSNKGANNPQKIEMAFEDFKYYNTQGNGYSIFGS